MEEKNDVISLSQSNEFAFAKKLKSFLNKYYWYFFSVGIIIFALLCFVNLGKMPLQNWDEARHGINAYEMIRHNNFIANYFQDEFDYWNLKPPISYWSIILGFKIFGYNTFGMRFFSAFSMLLVCVIVALALKFKDKNSGDVASITSIILFISCYKLLQKHCIRSADADALFLLFFTIAIISLMMYKRNILCFYLCGIAFSLMFLTKSWHSFILIPIVFFYLIANKGFKHIKWWQFVIFFACSIFLIIVWAVIRYTVDGTVFLKEMLWYDLFKRTQGTQGENVHSIRYYLSYVFATPNILSIGFCFNAIILIIKLKNKEKLSSITKLCVISFLSIFTIYAISKVKLYWYLYPLAIPFILMASESVEKYVFIKLNKKYKNVLKNVTYSLTSICLACCIAISFVYVFKLSKEIKPTYGFVAELVCDIEKDGIVYYQDSSTVIENINITPDRFDQAQVLYLELSIDAHTKYGKEELEKFYTIQELQQKYPNYNVENYDTNIKYAVEAYLANKNQPNYSKAYIIVDNEIFNMYSSDLKILKTTSDNFYHLCQYK